MSRRAFSLIEMLVVLGILILLLSILMPVVGNARDAANGTLCASHVRTLTQACLAFASEHDGHLPGTLFNWGAWDRDPDHWDWLYGQYSNYNSQQTTGTQAQQLQTWIATAPQYGTLWKYVNNSSYATTNLPGSGAFKTYLCPSLTTSIPGSGLGSNGRFDYAIFGIFNGAAIKDIPATSIMHYLYDPNHVSNTPYPQSQDPRWSGNDPRYNVPVYNSAGVQTGMTSYDHSWSTQYQTLPTPLVCQEDALRNINSNCEGDHSSGDQMSHDHRGGSYYGSVDGSVTWVNEPDIDLYQSAIEGTDLWEAVPPSGGTPILLNHDYQQWNWWGSENQGNFQP